MSPDKWYGAMKQKLCARNKMVLVTLAYRQNDKLGDFRGCFPSIGTIAEDAGMSQDSVMRALKELEAAGLITIDRGAKHHAYRLNVTGKVARSDLDGSQSATEQVAGCDPKRSIEDKSIEEDEEDAHACASLTDLIGEPAFREQFLEQFGPLAPEATDDDIDQAAFDAEVWAAERGQRVEAPARLIGTFLINKRKKGGLDKQRRLNVVDASGATTRRVLEPRCDDIGDNAPIYRSSWAVAATGTDDT